MSHGPRGEVWGIMWDNCWIALASGNQKGGKRSRGGGGGGRPEDSAGTGGGLGPAAGRGFCAMVVGEEFKGGITTRGGRSSWIDRESSVRCYTTGKDSTVG